MKLRAGPVLSGLAIAATIAVAAGWYAVSRIEPAALVRFAGALIHDATGRDLQVAGTTKLTVSFAPTVSLEEVRFANAPWGSQASMLTAKRIEFGISLLPLL